MNEFTATLDDLRRFYEFHKANGILSKQFVAITVDQVRVLLEGFDDMNKTIVTCQMQTASSLASLMEVHQKLLAIDADWKNKFATFEADIAELRETATPLVAQLNAIRRLIDYPEEPIDIVLVDKIRAILNPENHHD